MNYKYLNYFFNLRNTNPFIKDRIINSKQNVLAKSSRDFTSTCNNKESYTEVAFKAKNAYKDHYVIGSSFSQNNLKFINHGTHLHNHGTQDYTNEALFIPKPIDPLFYPQPLNSDDGLAIVWNNINDTSLLNNINLKDVSLKNFEHIENHRFSAENLMIKNPHDKITLFINNEYLPLLNSYNYTVLRTEDDYTVITISSCHLSSIYIFDHNAHKKLDFFSVVNKLQEEKLCYVIYASDEFNNISNLICSDVINEDVKIMIDNFTDIDNLEKQNWRDLLDMESEIHKGTSEIIKLQFPGYD